MSEVLEKKSFITDIIISSEGEKRIFLIAFLASMAISLSIIEHIIPKPLPWMRLGLANAITLYSFTVLKPKEVLLLVLTRVIAASLLIGTFLSITFLLSFSGALSSYFMMFFIFTLFKKMLSLIGISVIGALTSNAVQLLLINFVFINSRLSYYFLPFILLFALVGGLVSGFFGRFLANNI